MSLCCEPEELNRGIYIEEQQTPLMPCPRNLPAQYTISSVSVEIFQ